MRSASGRGSGAGRSPKRMEVAVSPVLARLKRLPGEVEPAGLPDPGRPPYLGGLLGGRQAHQAKHALVVAVLGELRQTGERRHALLGEGPVPWRFEPTASIHVWPSPHVET